MTPDIHSLLSLLLSFFSFQNHCHPIIFNIEAENQSFFFLFLSIEQQ